MKNTTEIIDCLIYLLSLKCKLKNPVNLMTGFLKYKNLYKWFQKTFIN